MASQKTLGLILGSTLVLGSALGVYLGLQRCDAPTGSKSQEAPKPPQAATSALENWMKQKKRGEYETFKAQVKTELPGIIRSYQPYHGKLDAEAANYILSLIGLEPRGVYSELCADDAAVNYFAHCAVNLGYNSPNDTDNKFVHQVYRLLETAQEVGDSSVPTRATLMQKIDKLRPAFEKEYLGETEIPQGYSVVGTAGTERDWDNNLTLSYYSYADRIAQYLFIGFASPTKFQVRIDANSEITVHDPGLLKTGNREATDPSKLLYGRRFIQVYAVDFKPVSEKLKKAMRIRSAFNMWWPDRR
jgi:hypothetical protein